MVCKDPMKQLRISRFHRPAVGVGAMLVAVSCITSTPAVAGESGDDSVGAEVVYRMQDQKRAIYYDDSTRLIASISVSNPMARYRKNVVRVGRGCSGVLLKPAEGLILTAGHCVSQYRSATEIEVEFTEVSDTEGMVTAHATSWRQVPDLDVALLWLDESAIERVMHLPTPVIAEHWSPRPMFASDYDKEPDQDATELYLLGYPTERTGLTLSDDCQVVRSLIQVPLKGTARKFRSTACDCDANFGNSGSPVFDRATNAFVGVFWGGDPDHESADLQPGPLGPYEVFTPVTLFAEMMEDGNQPLVAKVDSGPVGDLTAIAGLVYGGARVHHRIIDDSLDTRTYPAAGLGLSLAADYVHAVGGRFTLGGGAAATIGTEDSSSGASAYTFTSEERQVALIPRVYGSAGLRLSPDAGGPQVSVAAQPYLERLPGAVVNYDGSKYSFPSRLVPGVGGSLCLAAPVGDLLELGARLQVRYGSLGDQVITSSETGGPAYQPWTVGGELILRRKLGG